MFPDQGKIDVAGAVLHNRAVPDIRHLPGLVVFLLVCLVSGACTADEVEPSRPEEIVVLTRNAPTSYFVDRDGQVAGPEYEMAQDFARTLDRPVRFEVFDSTGEVLEALEAGRGQIAAAGLTETPSRDAIFHRGPGYLSVLQELVCRPGLPVESVQDLPGLEIAVIADSSYEDTLGELARDLPQLSWQTVTNQATEQLLYDVAEGEIDCTVADSNILAVHQRYLPRLESTLTLGEETSLVWYVAPDHQALVPEIEGWFTTFASDRLPTIVNRYYGHLDHFDAYDVEVFRQRVEERLPAYRALFEAAAAETGFDWALLAAMSYQESQWDPEAVSPTGVRGMMMLTESTAEAVDVEDRLDPGESIAGGARYLAERMSALPTFIPDSERVWMALAAYNIGQGHLRDARMLAVRLGENPNTWAGVKEVLPLLAERRYHQDLLGGYARGLQPVVYVERIRYYLDLLNERLEAAE